MSRKLEMVRAAANGEAPPSNLTSEKLDELETAEVQDKILNPTSTIIELVAATEDGKPDTVELPEEFTLKAIFRNKVTMRLAYYFEQIQMEIRLRTDNMILMKPSVQRNLEEMLSEITGKPKNFFTDRLDVDNTKKVWDWMVATLVAIGTKAKDAKVEADSKK